MIRPVKFAGPWKGMISSMSPDQIPPAYVSQALNVFFKTGRLQTASPIRVHQYAPRRYFWESLGGGDYAAGTDGGRISDIVAAKYIETAGGGKHTLYATNDNLWLGGGDRAFNVSIDPRTGVHCGWSYTGEPVQILHFVGEVSEWICVSNGVGPYLWRLNLAFPLVFEKYVPETGIDFIPLLSGHFMQPYAGRIFFGAPITPSMDQLHGIGWWGISGPFDNTYPSCGTLSLSDVPGNVTGLDLIAEFLTIFKEDAIYLGQKTDVLESPIAVPGARITGVGCPHHHTIQRIGRGNALAFVSNQNRVTVFDGSDAQAVDDPVRDIIEAQNPATAWAFYDPIFDNYMLVYEDISLSWNVRENWWTTEQHGHRVNCAATQYIMKKGLTINELENDINGQQGTIDNLGEGAHVVRPCYIGNESLSERASDTEVEALVRTAELRVEKPTELTRLILRVRAPHGGKISVRHSLDGGGSWYPWQTVTGDDFVGVARLTYDFIDTSEQFTFEFKIVGREVTIEDAVVDVVVHQMQEENVTLFTNADFSTSRGVGV